MTTIIKRVSKDILVQKQCSLPSLGATEEPNWGGYDCEFVKRPYECSYKYI